MSEPDYMQTPLTFLLEQFRIKHCNVSNFRLISTPRAYGYDRSDEIPDKENYLIAPAREIGKYLADQGNTIVGSDKDKLEDIFQNIFHIVADKFAQKQNIIDQVDPVNHARKLYRRLGFHINTATNHILRPMVEGAGIFKTELEKIFTEIQDRFIRSNDDADGILATGSSAERIPEINSELARVHSYAFSETNNKPYKSPVEEEFMPLKP